MKKLIFIFILSSLIITSCCDCSNPSRGSTQEQKLQRATLVALKPGDYVFLRDRYGKYQEVEVLYNDPKDQFIKLHNPDTQENNIGKYDDIMRNYFITQKRE